MVPQLERSDRLVEVVPHCKERMSILWSRSSMSPFFCFFQVLEVVHLVLQEHIRSMRVAVPVPEIDEEVVARTVGWLEDGFR